MLHGDWIGRWGDSFPEAEALVDVPGGRRYRYAELRDDVYRMSEFLWSELGIRKGDRIAVLSLNRAEYIILFFASSRIGAVLVPLNYRLAPNELPYYLENSTPKLLFYDDEHRAVAEWLRPRAGATSFVSFADFASARPRHAARRPPEIRLSFDDPQLIIYTSGTTGPPKGVIMTHRMITWNSINTNLGWGLRQRERTILHSALYYTGGWNVLTLPLFHNLGANILIERFDAELILELIAREHVTVFFAVPTMFKMMMESPEFKAADFSNVRLVFSGGSPLPEEIFQAFKTGKGIHIREGYGLTEAGPNNFMANGKRNTVGNPMPHVDIRIIGEDGGEAPAGKEGELLLSGDHVTPGYWNKPQATAEVIEDGWLHTGDLARIDEDGHVSIIGRKKDMFISGGINIYPAEIEPLIASHPEVAGAAVIGVPDERWGEVGKAIVELKPGGALTLAGLQAFLSERIGKYKIPKYLTLVDSLPKTAASGKVQKFMLRDRYGKADNE